MYIVLFDLKLHVVRETIVGHVHVQFVCVSVCEPVSLAVNPNQFHCLHAVRVEIVTTFQKHAITREQEHTCNLFNILLHMFLYIYFAQNSLLLSVHFLFVSYIVESLNICVHKILLKLSRKMIQSNYLVTKIIIASRIKMLGYRGKNTDSLSKKRMFRYSICKPATCFGVTTNHHSLLIAMYKNLRRHFWSIAWLSDCLSLIWKMKQYNRIKYTK